MFTSDSSSFESPRITRRRLLSGAAGLTVMTALAGCKPVTAGPRPPQGIPADNPPQAPEAPTADSDVYVDYEYGDLKEVVVGIPYGFYPDVNAVPWLQEALKVLPEHTGARRSLALAQIASGSPAVAKQNVIRELPLHD